MKLRKVKPRAPNDTALIDSYELRFLRNLDKKLMNSLIQTHEAP